MKLFARVSQLMTANINHLLDQAEDPEVMIKQIIRDMDEAIVELRREAVSAVAREKQLGKQIGAAEDLAKDLEGKARFALDQGDHELSRRVLGKKIRTLKSRDALVVDLDGARKLAEQLTTDLRRMEEQAQTARVKKDELLRRKRAADARLRTQEAAQRSAAAVSAASGRLTGAHAAVSAFDSFSDAIMAVEAEAEAARELSPPVDDSEIRLQKMAEESELEQEFARLLQERDTNR
jgi:phage shock protein A